VARQRTRRIEADRAGPAAETVATIAEEILRSFALLKGLSARRIARRGLTMTLRSILQDLDEKGPRTVPQIAAERTMTRQSIQASVDQLRAMGLAGLQPNPAHRRSPIIGLTKEGEAVWRRVRQEELAALASLAGPLSDFPLDSTRDTLRALREQLQERLSRDL
jgi:DNA-binding MarR family transcriptional regulator